MSFIGRVKEVFKPTKEGQAIILSGMTQEETLDKSVKPVSILPELFGRLEQSKAVFSLESTMATSDQVYTKKGRLLDKELKDLAQYDSIISLIVSTRSNQMLPFGQRTRSKYDRGFLCRELTPVQDDITVSEDRKQQESEFRRELILAINKWVVNCGTANKNAVNFVFRGSDSTFKKCSLSEFLSAQSRNLLVFGRCATQIIRNKDGVPVMFRPLPVETVYRVVEDRIVKLATGDDVTEASEMDAETYNAIQEDERPIAYIQRIEGKDVAFFTEDDLRMDFYQKQAYEGLDGYPLCPIELATYTIGLHFSAQNYMQNSLTRGLASKGIINLKTTEGGVVSKEDVEHFRKLFSNYVARNDNSATIPVMSGPLDIQFVELNATSKDLEFLNLYNKVIMILCASFQISPHEIGFGHLTSQEATAGNTGGQQDQIIQGEERGLRQLLDKMFSIVTEIVAEAFPQSKDLIMFEAIGLGQNTKEADLSVYKEELQTSGTFSKIWGDSEHPETFPFGGNVPTSPIFHQNVAIYMKMSEMRHHFFGDKEALKDPALDFFLFPAFNEAYQGLKANPTELQQEQVDQQLQQGAIQTKMMEMQAGGAGQEQQSGPDPELENQAMKQEMELDQQKHEMEMKHEQEKHGQKQQLEKQKDGMKLQTEQVRQSETQRATINEKRTLREAFNQPK